MKTIKKNLKWITIVIVVIIVIIAFYIKCTLLTNNNKESSPEENKILIEEVTETKEETVQPTLVYVDIKGAIQNPGVYEIEENKKVIDVVQLAGGLTEQADTSMVNLAKKVSNEMVIIIYTMEEVKKALAQESIAKIVDNQCICPKINNDACLEQNTETSETTVDNEDQKININTATIDELLTLSGIGESKAKAIIEYREANGNFQKIEDIMEVPGIGEALYEKIKANITI